MDISSRTALYSYDYSSDVVEHFIESYSRVTIFMAKQWEMAPKTLRNHMIEIFRTDQPRWRGLRDTLKAIHNQNLYDDIRQLDRKQSILYYTAVRLDVEDETIPEKNYQNHLKFD